MQELVDISAYCASDYHSLAFRGDISNAGFGSGCAINSNGAVIGFGRVDSGDVYTYDYSPDGEGATQSSNPKGSIYWKARPTITVANKSGGPSIAFSYSGNRIFIGVTTIGVYVSNYDGAVWSATVLVNEPIDYASGAGYALSTCADGSIFSVGTLNKANETMSVYEYSAENNIWSLKGNEIEYPDGSGANERFSFNTAMSGDGQVLVVSAYSYAGIHAGNGIVYIWRWDGSVNDWVQKTVNSNQGTSKNDLVGRSVDLSFTGDRMVASAILSNNNNGTFWIFGWNESTGEYDRLSINNVETISNKGRWGWRVRMSPNGKSVAITSSESDISGINMGRIAVCRDETYTGSYSLVSGSAINGISVNSGLGYDLDMAKSSTDDKVRIISYAWKYNNNKQGYVEIFDIST